MRLVRMRLVTLVAASLATCPLGCSFFVNFSELSKESASGSDSGVDASPDCCDDGDPCTTDICDAEADGGCRNPPIVCTASDTCHVSACVEGKCEETAIEGFVDDGFSSELAGDFIFRTTTVAAGGRFYVATYGTFDGERDIVLNAYPETGDAALEFRFRDPDDLYDLFPDVVIASPAAVAVDNTYVNVYFATRPSGAPDDAAGHMQRVRFARFDINQGDLVPEDSGILTNSANFRGGDNLGPAAGLVGDPDRPVPFVVWPGCATISDATPTCVEANHPNNGVYVQSGFPSVNLENAIFFREGARITGLAALGSGTQLGAAWMVQGSSGAVTLQTAFLADDGTPTESVELSQCIEQGQPQGYALASAANAEGSLRVLGQSQLSVESGAYATQLETLTCVGAMCTESDPDCVDTDRLLVGGGSSDAVRNVDVTAITDQYFARATVTNPLIGPGDSGETASKLELVLWRPQGSGSADAGVADGGVDTWSSEPQVLSELTSRYGSLDWPSIAASGDRVLVAWKEPRASKVAVRHLARHRVCLPENP